MTRNECSTLALICASAASTKSSNLPSGVADKTRRFPVAVSKDDISAADHTGWGLSAGRYPAAEAATSLPSARDCKKLGCFLFGGRGRLTSAVHRRKVIELIGEANAAGAGLLRACGVIGICLRTLKRGRKAFLGDGGGVDRRKGSARLVGHRLSEEERQEYC